MRRRVFLALLLPGLAAFSGCGKKGPIEPPLVRVPQAVQDLALAQKGRQIFLRWSNPEAYIDGNPIDELATVEVWLARVNLTDLSPSQTWTSEEFEDKAELLIRITTDMFGAHRVPEQAGAGLSYVYAPKEEDFGRLVLAFALRVKDRKNRASAFSEPVSFALQAPPLPPQNTRAVVFEDHIQVRWETGNDPGQDTASGGVGGYNLYRSEEKEPARRLNSVLIKQPEYSDREFSFGRTYRYFVRAVLESVPQVESEDSMTVEILARDTFPPAPPSGLSVIGGPGFIALSWESSREPDLGGYKVWRRIAGRGEFVPIASLTAAESAFQDTEVEKQRRYEYAISAFDTAGNESRMSKPAVGIMRDSPPE